MQPVPDQMARRLGVKGALIYEVQPDSPAAKAGLRPTHRDEASRIEVGDVIVAVDGKPVRSTNDLLDLLERHEAGDTVTLTVLRDGQERQVTVKLDTIQQGGLA